MDVLEAIRTTRAMRRLDESRLVSDADLRRWSRRPPKRRRAATASRCAGSWSPTRAKATAGRGLPPLLPQVDGRRRGRCAVSLGPSRGGAFRRGTGASRRLHRKPGAPPGVGFSRGPEPHAGGARPGPRHDVDDSHLEDEAAVKEILGIPDGVHAYCIIPIGFHLAAGRGEAETCRGDCLSRRLGRSLRREHVGRVIQDRPRLNRTLGSPT